jgi:hypothetical protein
MGLQALHVLPVWCKEGDQSFGELIHIRPYSMYEVLTGSNTWL